MTPRRKLKILVVGINFAPEQTGIGPYTAAAADYLAARGHEVTVSTGIPHYPSWSVPPSYRGRLLTVERSSGLMIRRLRHFVPQSQDALRRGLYELTFAAQVLLRGRADRPDVVLAVVPSLLSAAVAARVARRSGAKLVVWVQDLMSAAAVQSGMEGGQLVAGAVAHTEKWILHRAASVVVATDSFRSFAVGTGVPDERIVTIPNWARFTFSDKDRELTRAEQGWREDDIIVLHTGNMGLKQDLSRVVDCARLSEDEGQRRVVFVLMGEGSQRGELEARCRAVENVRVVDPVPESEYLDVLAAADMLLVNERVGVLDMSLPSKLTSYLASGRPIAAAVGTSGCTATEILRSGGGVVTRDQTPEAIIETVRTLAADAKKAAGLGLRGRQYAEEHLRPEASLAGLAELLEDGSVLHVPGLVDAEAGAEG